MAHYLLASRWRIYNLLHTLIGIHLGASEESPAHVVYLLSSRRIVTVRVRFSRARLQCRRRRGDHHRGGHLIERLPTTASRGGYGDFGTKRERMYVSTIRLYIA